MNLQYGHASKQTKHRPT